MKIRFQTSPLISILASVIITGCAATATSTTSNGNAEDNSASGAAASAATSAVGGSSSTGTVAFQKGFNLIDYFIPNALANTACPTPLTIGAGCANSAGNMWLTYSGCNIGVGAATWTGVQLISKSSGVSTCGIFPPVAAASTISRQAVTASAGTTPGSMTRVSPFGTSETIDDASTKLSNFNGDAVTANVGTGFGTVVTFNGAGLRTGVNIAQRIFTSVFDHTIVGSLAVVEGSTSAATRLINGSIAVYHNKLRVIGTAVFTNVVHSLTCCQPIGGSVTTTFAAGGSVAPTIPGALIVGHSETLAFTGCGTATYTAPSGTVSTVNLSHCF